jgi:hypothetical protein
MIFDLLIRHSEILLPNGDIFFGDLLIKEGFLLDQIMRRYW